MIELFYFDHSDLLIKVEYAKLGNSLSYASHREMRESERMITEQYVLGEVAPKTDYYRKYPAKFVYLGSDKRLEKRLSSFHYDNDVKSLNRHEQEITESVTNLINESMLDYYTEKIGELLISVRSELESGRQYDAKFTALQQQLKQLLNAYNVYADHKLMLSDIIPSELKTYWSGLEESRYRVVTT